MTENLSTDYITDYLDSVVEQVQRLMSLLQDERNILSSNDGNALEAITSRKEKLAQTIQVDIRRCGQKLQLAGFGHNNLSLNNYINTCSEPLATQLKSAWDNLQSLLKQCQEENRINGKLINSSQRRIKQALSILQGKPVEEDLYGSGGESINSILGNSLTHA